MKKALLSLVAAAVLMAATKKPEVPASEQPFHVALSQDQRIAHAAGRLTFGATPGDTARLRQVGLSQWIDDQLHPERTPESATVTEKLKPLLSLQMDGAEMFKNYPPPQAIKQMYQGGLPLPADPLLKASVELQIDKYRARKSDDPAAVKTAAQPDPAVAREAMLTVLDDKQITTLRSGTAAEKRTLLASLPSDQIDQALLAMPVNLRRSLIPVASTEVRRKILLLNNPQQVIPYDLNEAKLLRAIYSNHQLAELMTDFWYNHFNVFLDKGADRTLVTSYERDAIRPNVFGKFRDLLGATAHSPAMMFYLDNWESVAADTAAKTGAKRTRGLNENYARELLELHTLGVDAGYTQQDIIEVARCFTGWTIRAPRQGGDFYYNDKVHDKGAKTVLGVTIPAGGGQSDGDKVLDILVDHPSTARFISRKLAMRFVADEPPQALIDRMAKTFQATGGDIREVLKTMINSPEFFSQGAFQAKIKTPFEMTVSAVRATGATVDSASTIAQRLNDLGQPLYRKIEPTGYSSKNAEWMNSSALLARMNFALALTQGKLPGISVSADQLGGETDPTQLAQRLLPVPLSAATRDTIAKAMETTQPGANTALVAGLLLGSPEFQRK